MLNATARAQAALSAITQANPAMAKASAAEQQQLTATLTTLYAADNAYLVGAVQVVPGTLAAPAGQPVATAGSAAAQTGATTAPGPLTGVGGIT